MALKKLLEGARRDRLAGMQSQGNRALAMPGARVPVLGPLGTKVRRILAFPQIVAASWRKYCEVAEDEVRLWTVATMTPDHSGLWVKSRSK